MKAAGIRIEPVTPDQAQAARSAHLQFGKGTGHSAALNYGDCFAYALAKIMDAPLLCKGNDFPSTDIGIAWTLHCSSATKRVICRSWLAYEARLPPLGFGVAAFTRFALRGHLPTLSCPARILLCYRPRAIRGFQCAI
jgi:hypothetical protein